MDYNAEIMLECSKKALYGWDKYQRMYSSSKWSSVKDKFNIEYPHSWEEAFMKLSNGDRVEIRNGYNDEGKEGTFIGRSLKYANKSIVKFGNHTRVVVDESIVAKPYTYEEKMERAIDTYQELLRQYGFGETLSRIDRAMVAAVVEAGI